MEKGIYFHYQQNVNQVCSHQDTVYVIPQPITLLCSVSGKHSKIEKNISEANTELFYTFLVGTVSNNKYKINDTG